MSFGSGNLSSLLKTKPVSFGGSYGSTAPGPGVSAVFKDSLKISSRRAYEILTEASFETVKSFFASYYPTPGVIGIFSSRFCPIVNPFCALSGES